MHSINSPFELQIDFQNDCNLIYGFFVEFKICSNIRLRKRHGIYDRRIQAIYARVAYFPKGI